MAGSACRRRSPARWRTRGRLSPPRAPGSTSRASTSIVPAVEVSADLAGSRFVIDRLTLASGNGRIDGRGDIDLTRNTYTAHVTASDVPVTPLIGIADSDVPMSGRASTAASTAKARSATSADSGRVSLADARWKDADLGNITADVTLEGRNASVAVDAPELALKGNGSIGVDPRGTLAVRGEWTPHDVAAIAAAAGRGAVYADQRFGRAAVRAERHARSPGRTARAGQRSMRSTSRSAGRPSAGPSRTAGVRRTNGARRKHRRSPRG